jgi:hypothetical protein
MTLDDYRYKHQAFFQNQGSKGNVNYCVGCIGPNDTLIQTWPCDVIKVLDIIEPATKKGEKI